MDSFFRDNIWGFDLVNMLSLSKYNKGIKYFLCIIDLFSKYAWVKYSNGKNFNSFINKFYRATNEEDKRKVVKELKEINNSVSHYIEKDEMNENSEYRSKLFDIANAIEYFV